MFRCFYRPLALPRLQMLSPVVGLRKLLAELPGGWGENEALVQGVLVASW